MSRLPLQDDQRLLDQFVAEHDSRDPLQANTQRRELAMINQPRVALVCRDKANKDWGRRWLLSHTSKLELVSDPTRLIAEDYTLPDVLVMESSIRLPGGDWLVERIAGAGAARTVIVALCHSSRDFNRVKGLAAVDPVRRPYDWELISRRVDWLVERSASLSRLDRAEAELSRVRRQADTVRESHNHTDSYDVGTGLPNRAKFEELLARGIPAILKNGYSLALIVIGFPRFKLVSEAFGQQRGERIVAEIGQRLVRCLAEEMTGDSTNRGFRTTIVSRFDRSRFAVMLASAGDDGELTAARDRILSALAEPIQVDGQTAFLSASLGMVNNNEDVSAAALLQRAENAMREAQARGISYLLHQPEHDAAAARKLLVESKLLEALENGDLDLFYQPIVRTADRELMSAEVLLRWPDGNTLDVSTEEFISVAEESELILRIGQFVLDRACAQLREWREAGLEIEYLCLNVAKPQLLSSEYTHLVVSTLAQYGLMPDDIELELSERGVLSGDAAIVKQLVALKQAGVRLSIDDFGTGDSAIAYLKGLPIDALKIDRSYIRGMLNDPRDAAITSAMVALGQRLDLVVIAEGVEQEQQLASLIDMGCDACQGYLFARALSCDDFFAAYGCHD